MHEIHLTDFRKCKATSDLCCVRELISLQGVRAFLGLSSGQVRICPAAYNISAPGLCCSSWSWHSGSGTSCELQGLPHVRGTTQHSLAGATGCCGGDEKQLCAGSSLATQCSQLCAGEAPRDRPGDFTPVNVTWSTNEPGSVALKIAGHWSVPGKCWRWEGVRREGCDSSSLCVQLCCCFCRGASSLLRAVHVQRTSGCALCFGGFQVQELNCSGLVSP